MPLATGLKVTEILQFAPEASVAGQVLLLTVNAPVTAVFARSTDTEPVPVLDKVTASGVLDVLMATAPNCSVPGLTDTAGAVPKPLKAEDRTPALVVIGSDDTEEPAWVGAN